MAGAGVTWAAQGEASDGYACMWSWLARAQAPAVLQVDRKLVLAEVGSAGFARGLASEALRADRKLVFAAVGYGESARAFASKDLRADLELVFEAVSYAYHTARPTAP